MFHYQVADHMAGARNLIEAAGVDPGETVLLLCDRRSDPVSTEALIAALTAHGARCATLTTEPVSRYGTVPELAMAAMASADAVIWMWPVFLTFSENFRRRMRLEREDHLPTGTTKRRPYYVYCEAVPGLLASDYARFPNAVLWKIAERVRAIVAAGRTVRLENDRGTRLTCEYDSRRLFGMQFGPGDPPGRCHFPWGRCGVFNGEGTANGVVALDCIQGVAGRLSQPLVWRVEDGAIADVGGDAEMAAHCRRLFAAVPESRRLNEVMFGYHPKASVGRGLEDPMHWELISKMPWVGLGTPRGHVPFRHVDGAVLQTRLYIDDRLLVDDSGRIAVLDDPEVREVAARCGDPDEVLAPVAHEAHGSGTVW